MTDPSVYELLDAFSRPADDDQERDVEQERERVEELLGVTADNCVGV